MKNSETFAIYALRFFYFTYANCSLFRNFDEKLSHLYENRASESYSLIRDLPFRLGILHHPRGLVVDQPGCVAPAAQVAVDLQREDPSFGLAD